MMMMNDDDENDELSKLNTKEIVSSFLCSLHGFLSIQF